MAAGGEEEDTAMSLALKRAAGEKFRKGQQRREERRQAKQARLDRIKVKPPEAEPGPQVVPAPQTGASLQVSAQHFLQDKVAHERRVQQLAAIALGKVPAPEPARVERLPPPPPSGPDDPRILNGTLAPSPKVAAMLKAGVSEDAAEIATEARRQKRAEQTGHPEGWLEILANGSSAAVLAGRRPIDLKGDDREAYERALRREMEAACAGRSPSALTGDDRAAYYRARHSLTLLVRDPRQPRKRRKGALRCAVGLIIDKRRHKAGLTLKQLAEQTGLASHTIQQACRGTRPFTLAQAEQLAGFFKTSPEIFMSTTPIPMPASKSGAKPPPASLNGITPPKTNANRPGYSEQHDLKRLVALTEPRDTDTAFQANLRRIMRLRGLMGEHVAKLCGLSRDVPARLLRVGSLPRPETRKKLIAGLGVTEAELCGPAAALAAQAALQAPVQAEAATTTPAPVEAMEEAPDGTMGPVVLTGPMVPVEMGMPMPPVVLLASRYPWDMPKGGSFKAEVPFGLEWPTFRSRFLKMVDRQSDSLGHWYTFEESEAEGFIRVWRII